LVELRKHHQLSTFELKKGSLSHPIISSTPSIWSGPLLHWQAFPMSKHSAPSAASKLPIPVELIEHRIYFVRGQKVMLDSDLAQLYQVLTKNLNKAISRNRERFPEDFMFQLTKAETESLRFQIGTSNVGRGGRRYLP
jgi:hypothetical protein